MGRHRGHRLLSPGHGLLAEGLDPPVVEYTHSEGCAVTGGVVYRGCRMPGYAGTYFYGDFCSGFVRSLPARGGSRDGRARLDRVLGAHESLTSFGTDADGEVYMLELGGQRLQDRPRRLTPARGRYSERSDDEQRQTRDRGHRQPRHEDTRDRRRPAPGRARVSRGAPPPRSSEGGQRWPRAPRRRRRRGRGPAAARSRPAPCARMWRRAKPTARSRASSRRRSRALRRSTVREAHACRAAGRGRPGSGTSRCRCSRRGGRRRAGPRLAPRRSRSRRDATRGPAVTAASRPGGHVDQEEAVAVARRGRPLEVALAGQRARSGRGPGRKRGHEADAHAGVAQGQLVAQPLVRARTRASWRRPPPGIAPPVRGPRARAAATGWRAPRSVSAREAWKAKRPSRRNSRRSRPSTVGRLGR